MFILYLATHITYWYLAYFQGNILFIFNWANRSLKKNKCLIIFFLTFFIFIL